MLRVGGADESGATLANGPGTIHLSFVATGGVMATILILSSQVARGYVGGSAARVALEALGHDAWLIPTVILSNHPGHALFAGEQVPPGRLRAIIEALEGNGWLGEVDAVLTGYLPTPEHVAIAARTCETVRAANPHAILLCDPILGDDPGGLYVAETAATAIRDMLLPLADCATPNRFELAWLTGAPVADANEAHKAAQTLGPSDVLVTSVPGNEPDTLANLLVQRTAAWQTVVTRREVAPHGTGDVAAALFLGHRLNGAAPRDTLALATAGVEAVLEASGNDDELALVTARQNWTGAKPWPIREVTI